MPEIVNNIIEKENIPEKGAAIQRDMENYAIIPYIPGGLLDPATLHKIADVAEKYDVKLIKITSEHRIGFYGIKEEEINPILDDLDMEPGGFTGKCVRAVKFCIGNTSCKKGYQNTMELGLNIDKEFHKIPTPDKVKISLSGCPNSCAESSVRDIGLIGSPKGWKILVGGTCGLQVKKGRVLAKNLSNQEVLEIVGRIIEYYQKKGIKKRMGQFIETVGFDSFTREILGE